MLNKFYVAATVVAFAVSTPFAIAHGDEEHQGQDEDGTSFIAGGFLATTLQSADHVFVVGCHVWLNPFELTVGSPLALALSV